MGGFGTRVCGGLGALTGFTGFTNGGCGSQAPVTLIEEILACCQPSPGMAMGCDQGPCLPQGIPSGLVMVPCGTLGAASDGGCPFG